MSNLREFELALKILYERNLEKDKIKVLHYNSAYPTPLEDVNFKTILTIKNVLILLLATQIIHVE